MSDSQPTAPVEYRPIEGFPHYRVGNDGSVWSCRPGGRNGNAPTWFRMKCAPEPSHGYPRACLRKVRYGERTFSVHSLVLCAFVGPRPKGMDACHNDGDKTNNRASNLRWDTPKNNQKDRLRHGTMLFGSQASSAKLTEDQVETIKLRLLMGDTAKDLSRQYRVSLHAIRHIRQHEWWTHVKVPGLPEEIADRLAAATAIRRAKAARLSAFERIAAAVAANWDCGGDGWWSALTEIRGMAQFEPRPCCEE